MASDGHTYAPRHATGKLPALAVSGPFGAVKEQSSGLYVNEYARRGYVALASDPSFTGERRRCPRHRPRPWPSSPSP